MKTLTNKVVDAIISRGLAEDRHDALWKIEAWTLRDGFYCVASDYDVLVNGSAEDFAVSFMATWNDEQATSVNCF